MCTAKDRSPSSAAKLEKGLGALKEPTGSDTELGLRDGSRKYFMAAFLPVAGGAPHRGELTQIRLKKISKRARIVSF
jgi:hypothetical protein